MYTLKFFGKKMEIGGKTFLTLLIPILTVYLAAQYFIVLGLLKFDAIYVGLGYFLPAIYYISFSSIVINDKRYAFLPESKFTGYAMHLIGFASIIYYFVP